MNIPARGQRAIEGHMTSPQHRDVLIVGGGLAGLSLAIQLRRTCPDLSVAILEKRKHPLPEAAHKVGESTVEIGGHYYAEVVGMKEHLEKHQLLKPGLRFFFPAGANDDITRRIEVGLGQWPRYPTYQLDRGRFENALGEEAVRRGAEFHDGATVQNIELSSGGAHVVTATRDGERIAISCRWLVDASGRTGLLKRKLGLAQPVDHQVGAAWFRVLEPVDIDDFSDDPAWRSRAPRGLRRLCTNHLMGDGYWFWLIPLAGGSPRGSISFGIVAETNIHPFDTFNTQEKALAWLDRNEPQAARIVRAHVDKLADFLTLRRYAYGCKQVYSRDRWALVGEAGTFHDPFYSPGSDSIYVANMFVTDMIARDHRGEEVGDLVAAYNETYLRIFDGMFEAFHNNYPMWGNPQVMTMKIHYDYTHYWGFTALLAWHDRICDLAFMDTLREPTERLAAIYTRMQELLRTWNRLDNRPRKAKYIDQSSGDSVTYGLHCQLGERLADDQLRQRIFANVDTAAGVAVAIFRQAVRCCYPEHAARIEGRPLNPLAISLDPDRWDADGLFDASKAIEPDRRVIAEVQSRVYELDEAARA
jgi:flavin-dependent dehydrogenase